MYSAFTIQTWSITSLHLITRDKLCKLYVIMSLGYSHNLIIYHTAFKGVSLTSGTIILQHVCVYSLDNLHHTDYVGSQERPSEITLADTQL